jgi:hypothetical protein
MRSCRGGLTPSERLRLFIPVDWYKRLSQLQKAGEEPMLRIFAIALVGLFLALPCSADVPNMLVDIADGDHGNGSLDGRVDCDGDIIYTTGMYDEFEPPPGVATSISSGCFINALNEGGFPADGRRLADDWPAYTTDIITAIKVWNRYNANGYDYHLANDGLHGYCVKFYGEPDFNCPDGTLAGEEAIGPILYDQYVDDFVEEEIFTGLTRNFNACLNLPVPFEPPASEQLYWVSVAADFDFTLDATQWFWRMMEGAYDPLCEASWWDTWNTPPTNWMPVSAAVGVPGWAGWNAAFVLYSGEPTPAEETSWGHIKTGFR